MNWALAPKQSALAPIPRTSFVLLALHAVDVFEPNFGVQLDPLGLLSTTASGTSNTSTVIILHHAVSSGQGHVARNFPSPPNRHRIGKLLNFQFYNASAGIFNLRLTFCLIFVCLLDYFESFEIFEGFGCRASFLGHDAFKDSGFFLFSHLNMSPEAGNMPCDAEFRKTSKALSVVTRKPLSLTLWHVVPGYVSDNPLECP